MNLPDTAWVVSPVKISAVVTAVTSIVLPAVSNCSMSETPGPPPSAPGDALVAPAPPVPPAAGARVTLDRPEVIALRQRDLRRAIKPVVVKDKTPTTPECPGACSCPHHAKQRAKLERRAARAR